LSELERRLEWLDSYRQERILHLDATLKQAYAALEAVRDSCSYASGELIWGAAKQRARICVETLESRFQSSIPSKESLEQKAQASMKLMESYLSQLEARAYARQSNFSAALDEGWKRVDHSLTHTREIIDEGFDRARKAKDALKDSISSALLQAAETRLIRYEDLPHPWRVNPHILRGYRFTESKLECLTSIFRPSNESVNIWSHALGLFLVLALALYIYPTSTTFPLSTRTDVLISAIFFTAACKCLICSTLWHTMNGIADATLLSRFACVDYTGISFLVAASILSTEWTAFYCEPVSRTVYMSLTAILGLAGTILPWRPTFNRADMAWARVAFYISLAATGFAPVLQLNLTRGPSWSFYFYAPLAKSLAVYVVGAVVYASHIPERWCPGAFDYVGGSHNIWHLAVLGGILFHYAAMLEFFNGAFQRAGEVGGCLAT
jgi:adiponectin receptor